MSPTRLLAWFAGVVVVGHHVGTLVGPLGSAGGGTEWADWVDLAVPYAVVGTALAALHAAAAGRREWLLALVGAVLYTQGHGIHLAANSVGNARGDAAPVHLWDEVMGHYLWYGGLWLLVLALALSVRAPLTPGAGALAVLFGLTHATNGVEGGTAVLSLVVAAAFAWRFRRERLVLVAYGAAALLLAGWGLWWGLTDGRSFPQFSELGWI